jgi:hypothetical protein
MTDEVDDLRAEELADERQEGRPAIEDPEVILLQLRRGLVLEPPPFDEDPDVEIVPAGRVRDGVAEGSHLEIDTDRREAPVRCADLGRQVGRAGDHEEYLGGRFATGRGSGARLARWRENGVSPAVANATGVPFRSRNIRSQRVASSSAAPGSMRRRAVTPPPAAAAAAIALS